LRLIRQIHAYLGLLIAPSVLFFALSGGLQIFSLHEAHGGYHPPALFKTLGALHKDQVTTEPDHDHDGPPPSATGHKPDPDAHAGAPGKGAADGDDDHGHKPKASTLVLKLFFEVVATGLFTSTSLGLWIGLRLTRTPRLSWGLLAAGVVIPVLIVLI
jgi:hypothetical protein